jgi:hypothetical protein
MGAAGAAARWLSELGLQEKQAPANIPPLAVSRAGGGRAWGTCRRRAAGRGRSGRGQIDWLLVRAASARSARCALRPRPAASQAPCDRLPSTPSPAAAPLKPSRRRPTLPTTILSLSSGLASISSPSFTNSGAIALQWPHLWAAAGCAARGVVGAARGGRGGARGAVCAAAARPAAGVPEGLGRRSCGRGRAAHRLRGAFPAGVCLKPPTRGRRTRRTQAWRR